MANSSFRTLDSEKEKKVKHIYIMHTKFTNAFICFLFLFIGGPMGAIIRKGGFGMPLLISIGFFVSFIFLNLLFEKLAESFVLPAVLAAWMPNHEPCWRFLKAVSRRPAFFVAERGAAAFVAASLGLSDFIHIAEP